MADWRLLVASLALVAVALAHSYLGERYILMRLFRDARLPRIGPDDVFTRRTMRFAWHLTSVAWLGFVVLLAGPGLSFDSSGWVVGVTAAVFAVHALVVLVASRGHHLAWVVFTLVAGLLGWAAA